MIDSVSFTSEPQYQRPDNRASDINFVPKPPITIPTPAAVPPRNVVDYDYDPTFLQRFFDKLAHDMLVCNRLDFYGNAIPLGSFCFAIKFIVYGFWRCKVYCVNDTFLWAVVLLFGGVGQLTAGFMEYIKGRIFPTVVYTTFGFYCISHYGLYVIPEWFGLTQNMSMFYNYTTDSLAAFYGLWIVLTFGIMMTASKVNVLYMVQIMALLMAFLFRCLGEAMGSEGTKRTASGIFLVISGFFSLFMFASQMLNNETFYYQVFPCCPLNLFNDIDMMNTAPAPVTIATNAVAVATPVAATPVVTPVVPVAATPVTPVAATPAVVV